MDNSDPSIAFFPETCIFPKSGNEVTNGYFVLGIDGHQTEGVHRASYRLFVGPIPKNMIVMQTCDNHACINPKHLILGTATDRTTKWQKFGVNIHNAKLTPDIVRAIRASNMTDTDLAVVYGVGRTCIFNVRKGNTWKQVKAKPD